MDLFLILSFLIFLGIYPTILICKTLILCICCFIVNQHYVPSVVVVIFAILKKRIFNLVGMGQSWNTSKANFHFNQLALIIHLTTSSLISPSILIIEPQCFDIHMIFQLIRQYRIICKQHTPKYFIFIP